MVDTGQEFVNTRGADSNAEPLEFDSGMGILPEAIDMTGTNDLPGSRHWTPAEYIVQGLHFTVTSISAHIHTTQTIKCV